MPMRIIWGMKLRDSGKPELILTAVQRLRGDHAVWRDACLGCIAERQQRDVVELCCEGGLVVESLHNLCITLHTQEATLWVWNNPACVCSPSLAKARTPHSTAVLSQPGASKMEEFSPANSQIMRKHRRESGGKQWSGSMKTNILSNFWASLWRKFPRQAANQRWTPSPLGSSAVQWAGGY